MIPRRLGVYVHVPFCIRKCDYCAFVSYPGEPDAATASVYVEAALAELKSRAYGRPEGFAGWTLYVGGGTPTSLKGGRLERLISGAISAMATRGWGEPLEATVEANPSTFGHRSAASLVSSGITRFSIGVQSLVDTELKAIGRVHSAEDAEVAFDAARSAKPKSVSVDIMAGIPGQDAGSMEETLRGLAALGPDHVSCYGLQLEEGTRMKSAVDCGAIGVPGEDETADLMEQALEWLHGMGLLRYEVSNFAKPGHESIHNLLYWQDMPYLGIGAAAHSYDPGKMVRSWNVSELGEYVRLASEGSACEAGRETLGPARAMSDALIMALRTSSGARLEEIEARYKQDFDDAVISALAWGKANSLLRVGGDGRVFLTDRGFMLSNSLFIKLV